MLVTTSDPSRYLKQFFRIGRDNRKSFLFKNVDGSEKDLDGYQIINRFKVRQEDDDDDAVLELSIGDGLTVTGGRVDQAVIEANSGFDPAEYYQEWEIVQGGRKRNWFSGHAIWHNGPFDGVLDQISGGTMEFTDNGETIMVTIIDNGAGGGGTEHYRGEVSISGNLFPEDGGTNDMREGRPTRGDWFITTNTGTLLNRSEEAIEVPAGSMLYYTGDDDGDMQLGANWKINQG